ncbi:MAG: GNAT family N-acetyltransferase [Gemmatimonadetes bacterium]|nr:GNAT family N-acetyltransferase [Gemmatimonadota bacterium]MBT5963624.1 GNAT family N-acetyltransferase [Gemmatimonadota bacterium]MBT6625478.1 GNAT family N-acetyltransferase [Gemmatimonadota bacterium]
MIHIETERVIVRRMQDSDLEAYHEIDNHPGHCQFLSRPPHSMDQSRDFIATARDLPLGAEGHYLHVSVVLKQTDELIGNVCIKVESQTHGQGDVGWFLSSDHRGQGLATEACRAWIDFCFKELGLHRITARCDAKNTRSRAMMERLGMRREGDYKEIAFFDDVWHDQYCYAILDSEWTRARSA